MLGRVLSRALGLGKPASAVSGNPLAEYFWNNPGRLMCKWHHYFDIYHRHFAAFRGRSPVVVEIGAAHGGSLEMWRHYFGPGARIVGIDRFERCRELEAESIEILIGDQGDRGFLAQVRERVPQIDILIDDGGHTMQQQIATFEELYHHIQPNGIYLCEDVHSSYVAHYGGGFGRQGTYIEYAKTLVDRLHAWYSTEPDRFRVDEITRSTYAIHFYDSVVVIEKRPIELPAQSETGKPTFPPIEM